jgi:hypothetical protein
MGSIETFQRSPIQRSPIEPHEAADAVLASANTIAAIIHTIATAHVEYAGKTIQDGTEFLTRLSNLPSSDQAVNLHTEFARNSYQAFVVQTQKISELYVDLLEHSYMPFETLIANVAPAH